MKEAFQFLKQQRLLTIASHANDLWICSVYYGVYDGVIYFISTTDAKHSQDILHSSTVTFSAAWYNKQYFADRKSIQFNQPHKL